MSCQQRMEEDPSEIWENLSAWWDNDIGDGDKFHRELIFPSMIELLQSNDYSYLLDIGCGNGALLRFLYKKGATYVGVDYSKTFIQTARRRSEDFSSILYQQCDATKLNALKQISTIINPAIKFDVIICSMVMHDLSSIDALYEALPHLLKGNGQFVFAIPSPHYNSVYNSIYNGNDIGVLTTAYDVGIMKMEKAKPSQPYAQCNFHRSLSSYINPLAQKGFSLTEIREPVATDSALIKSSNFWRVASKIPQVLICSFKYQPLRTSIL